MSPRSLMKAVLLSVLVVASTAFHAPAVSRGVASRGQSLVPKPHTDRTQVVLQSTKKKNKAPFDEALRTKLVSESIAPWRTLRLFLYGSLGSGAAVGGFITLAGTAAALSGARTDLDLNTEVGLSHVAIYSTRYDLPRNKACSHKLCFPKLVSQPCN